MLQLYKNSKAKWCFLALILVCFGCEKSKTVIINNSLKAETELIYENNFDSDLSDWIVEQREGGKVEINNDKLEITDAKGCTVWLNKEFEGRIMIEYDAFIIDKGGSHDRVSDLNCFWMAKDPENMDNLFENSEKRGGKFSNYDSLRLYYMGVGGNDNSSTRFRRYLGNGERPLLPKHDLSDAESMLTANKLYHIRIIAYGGYIQYYRNDVLLSDFTDKAPYTSGYFGFRTVNNHMTVDNFKVYQLSPQD